ncbi:hypothetical protein WISP_23863 [Willisornis vidua]|uniref:Small integral membrane protein 20 n=1 Tax=Willisornis vidua TaxID=1566151 RepID=A0ABQ9DT65_9PASS|nr:hypothetical protein WISP_23863 [Willisornis vidua]
MARLSRTIGIFAAFAAVVGAAFYPIYLRPLLLPEEYKKEQSINRAGIVQEDIQPGERKSGILVSTQLSFEALWIVKDATKPSSTNTSEGVNMTKDIDKLPDYMQTWRNNLNK